MQVNGSNAAAAAPANAGEAAGPKVDSKLKDACEQFEGQFFDLMLQEMRKTVQKNPLLSDDGHTEEIFTGMMDEQIALDMAKHGGANDLAAQLYRQLTGASAAPPATAEKAAPASAVPEEPKKKNR